MNVREKKVDLFELFYDLVFVYAISRITLILEEPTGGSFTISQMAIYIISTLTVFQAWVFMTNYINRYGQWRWHEYLLLAINMFAAIYLAQSISSDWDVSNGRVFIASMMVLVTTVLVLYAIQMRKENESRISAKHGVICLGVVLALFVCALLASYTDLKNDAFYLLIAAIFFGAFLPFLVPKLYDANIVCFPHLAERFELLTIITFGEGIVGMTRYFDIHEFSSIPWTVFITFFMMFGCYVIQIHKLCNHHRVESGRRLMFSHYFIILSVNMITLAYAFFTNPEIDRLFTASLMTISLMLFFTGILSDSAYYFDYYHHSMKDVLISAGLIVVGAFIMFTFMDTDGILYGTFFAVFGNLMMFSYKFIKYRSKSSGESATEE